MTEMYFLYANKLFALLWVGHQFNFIAYNFREKADPIKK